MTLSSAGGTEGKRPQISALGNLCHRFVTSESNMASYTTLVNVDADIATKVCTFVSRLVGAEEGPAYLEVCKDFIEKRQTKQLIAQLLSKAELILDMESNSDVERIFQAILSVIYTLSDETKDTAEIVRSVLVCMSSAETQPSARLAVMVVLFNIIFSTESKCEVLTAMCEYALKTGQAAQVGHMLGKLEGAVAAWDVPVASKRGVLQAFAKVLEAQGESSVALRCLITFFKTFTATGAKVS
ncbi:hypothetical protein B484DRAFT_400879 [Ochromonadaceae sp. CCMP2298]|nr:hypothetical protein B484DRAFT_400879 [Ochromonadaceae sp. CCMP2298]